MLRRARAPLAGLARPMERQRLNARDIRGRRIGAVLPAGRQWQLEACGAHAIPGVSAGAQPMARGPRAPWARLAAGPAGRSVACQPCRSAGSRSGRVALGGRGRAERRAPGKPRAAIHLFEACIFWLCYDLLRCVHYYTRLCTGLPTHTAGTPGAGRTQR